MLHFLEIDQQVFKVGDHRYIFHPETGDKVESIITSIVPTIIDGDYVVNYQSVDSIRSEFFTYHSTNDD
jgi:hypothetical protein